MCVCFTYMSACALHLCPQSSEEAIDLLNLQLWMVESHHVDARNQTQVLCESKKCTKPLSHFHNPVGAFYCMCVQHYVVSLRQE